MKRIFPYNVKSIVGVHDGDTCTLIIDMGFDIMRTVSVRILGIDSPEMMGPSKAAAMVSQAQATKWLNDHVSDMILLSKELDKYGRILGDIQENKTGTTLMQFMLQGKLAKPYLVDAKKPWTDAECAALIAAYKPK